MTGFSSDFDGDGIVRGLVGLANPYGNGAAPSVLPTIAQLQISLGSPTSGLGLVSSAKVLWNDAVSFPLLSGNLSPFIGTSAFAQDSSLGELFVAQALTNQGQSVAANLLTGYSFSGYEGYQGNGPAFACSATPANCPANLLPALPVSTTGTLVPQVMTFVPSCEPFSTGTTTYCGTFSVQQLFSGGGSETLLGTFAFVPDAPSATSATQTISNCYMSTLGTFPLGGGASCTGSYDSATGTFQVSTTSGATLTVSGTATSASASGNVTYLNPGSPTGSGTFTGVALSP